MAQQNQQLPCLLPDNDGNICNRLFDNLRALARHQRVHSREARNSPYRCRRCTKGYKGERYYRRHLVATHPLDYAPRPIIDAPIEYRPGTAIGIRINEHRLGRPFEVRVSKIRRTRRRTNIGTHSTSGATLDLTARDAVDHAYNSALQHYQEEHHNSDFFDRHHLNIRINPPDADYEGGSMGAAVGVAILSLANNMPVRMDSLSSARISDDGTLDWVNGLSEKISGAKQFGFRQIHFAEEDREFVQEIAAVHPEDVQHIGIQHHLFLHGIWANIL